MGFFNALRSRDTGIAGPSLDTRYPGKDEPKVSQDATVGSDSDDTLSLEAQNEKETQLHPNEVTKNADTGIQKAEAAALVWPMWAVYCTYAWIWVGFFTLALQSSIMFSATAAAYSDFATAPAYTTASILSNIIGGVIRLPIAKALNLWGRAEAFLCMVGVYVLGLIILASCNGVNAYAAGYVLYWIGYDTVYIIMDVFIADTSGLRKRAFTFAFAATPFICTAFTGPLAAESFLTHTTWRWAIGAFAIIQPVVYLPLAIVFKFYERKAQKMGLYRHVPSGRTTMQSIVHYFHEFDIVGAFIIMFAFILFLLPFSLESYGRITYDGAAFICMIIFGILLFPTFYVWERFFARKHFIRWELFRNPTISGACLSALTLYFSFYCWNTNYYSFVKVLYALPISLTNYMTQIYNVGSCFWGVVLGVIIYVTCYFKWFTFYFGLGLIFLGSGLQIYFRGNDQGIGYLIMCQIFIAFSGGTLVISNQIAVMAASDRSGIALMLSTLFLFNSVGGAIGDAVTSAIFSSTWVSAYTEAAPAEWKSLGSELYLGGYLTQEMFPPGTPVREAINYAWEQNMRWSSTAATASLVLAIPAVLMWKNYRVDRKQNKGNMI
ncbi:hypothetical protein D0863_10510 [Hortaea werneckii]|uniref:Major facilitator superfamily (MFS) profile domain-containing protein n=1 Tax=Hortaea werneckii TaxID=91943 RepID=A0A3M7DGM2_HORWE|nr:hypothetical protein D0863_10510 [Hortaea werneckii]